MTDYRLGLPDKWLAHARKALEVYEPIERVDPPRPDYGMISFPVQLPEQIVVLESGELISFRKETTAVSFSADELRDIDPARFPYYLWQEVRKQRSDGKRREGNEEA